MVNQFVDGESLKAMTLEVARGITGNVPMVIQIIKEQIRSAEALKPLQVRTMKQVPSYAEDLAKEVNRLKVVVYYGTTVIQVRQ